MAETTDIHERGVADFGELWYAANRSAARIAHSLGRGGHADEPLITNVIYNTLRLAKGDYALAMPVVGSAAPTAEARTHG